MFASSTLLKSTSIILSVASVWIASSVSLAATNALPLSEMKYERQGPGQNIRHEYSIIKDRIVGKSRSGLPKMPTYTLVFKENQRPAKRLTLTRHEAELYAGSMNRLIWSSEYLRKPASTSPCREYVRIKMQNDQTKICQENKRLTGESYGLLKQLRAKFGR